MVLGLLGAGKLRESTLYDFSVVVKARLFVYNYNFGAYVKFTYADELPLQINPSEYRKNQKIGEAGKISLKDLNEPVPTPHIEYQNSMEIPLLFNVADEYAAISNNGLIPYDIDINTATPISKLFQYANLEYRVLLKWGPLEYLGYIDNFDCTYDLFSPYGQPLKAHGTLKLHEHFQPSLSGNAEKKTAKDLIGMLGWAKVKSHQIYSTAMVVAQKALETAANEALPGILNKTRG